MKLFPVIETEAAEWLPFASGLTVSILLPRSSSFTATPLCAFVA
jgi:hypothetical protein